MKAYHGGWKAVLSFRNTIISYVLLDPQLWFSLLVYAHVRIWFPTSNAFPLGPVSVIGGVMSKPKSMKSFEPNFLHL